MGQQLPDELLLLLRDQWVCRETQLKQLSALLSPAKPSPSTFVVYGPHATGKSDIVRSYLQASKLRHAIVQSRECVTGRHLFEKTTQAVWRALQDERGSQGEEEYNGRCENLSALAVQLQRLLRGQEQFVLVFDGVDKQRDAPPTLLPALGRFGETMPNLTTILIIQHPSPRFLHATGIPHINFPPYSRNQSIHILSHTPPDIFAQPPPPELEYDDETHEEDKNWLWPRFCAAVWDALGQNVARDFVSYRDVCHKLWRPFVSPIVKGDFGTRDFSRLLVNQRRLFQDESVLLESILTPQPPPKTNSLSNAMQQPKVRMSDLPYYAKWLLTAAYIASYNPSRLDSIYFMKSSERKRRKKGGGTAKTPSRLNNQKRVVPRHLSAPSLFTLDRLFAIMHAILPHDWQATADIYGLVATLTGLRLLVRAGGALGGGDVLEAGGKWRVGTAVTWDFVLGLARGLRFELEDYIAE